MIFFSSFHVSDDSEQLLLKIGKLKLAPNGRLTQEKRMLPVFPDVKLIAAFLFSVSKAFLKEYPMIIILIPGVIPFPFGPDPVPQIYADPDPVQTKMDLKFCFWRFINRPIIRGMWDQVKMENPGLAAPPYESKR